MKNKNALFADEAESQIHLSKCSFTDLLPIADRGPLIVSGEAADWSRSRATVTDEKSNTTHISMMKARGRGESTAPHANQRQITIAFTVK